MSQSLSNALCEFRHQAYWHGWSNAKTIAAIQELFHEHGPDGLPMALRCYFAA